MRLPARLLFRPLQRLSGRRTGRGRAVLGGALVALALSACGVLPPLPERTRLDASDIGLRTLTQPPRPPEIVARSGADLAAASSAASAERLGELASRERARRRPGPELAFFFESEIGRAYLAGGLGRALARGEPAAVCPAFGAALDRPSTRDAARLALERCLASRPRGTEGACGCRLIAAGSVLLAEPEAFDYARAVSAHLVGGAEAGGPFDVALVAEGPDPAGDGAPRRLALRGVAGPVGELVIRDETEAILTIGQAEYRGQWRAEGRRRGRLAGFAGLSDAKGRRLALLIGYEPAELETRQAALVARARALAP